MSARLQMSVRFRTSVRLCACLSAPLLLAGCRQPGREPELMSYEEYGRAPREFPYILASTAGRGRLLYIGTRHFFDPADPQAALIGTLWNEFRPTLAFNEGGNPPTLASASEAIARYGEPGLVRHLAARDGVPVRNIEPPEAEIAAALTGAGHTAAEVKLFLVLLAYDSQRRARSDETAEQFITRALRIESLTPGLEGPPNNLDEFAALYDELFPLGPGWREVPREWFAPTCTDTLLNRCARRMSQYRDRHMVNVLADAVARGERVFAVVGGSHTVMQEAALRSRVPALTRRAVAAR
ncbi:MAG: hypothetical protein AB1716_16760 [Planctomycetota bacterium]